MGNLKSWLHFLNENRLRELSVGSQQIVEEIDDLSYNPESSEEASDIEAIDEVEEEGKTELEESANRKKKTKSQKKEVGNKSLDAKAAKVKYLKSTKVTWESLSADFDIAATSYISAERVGLEALKKSSNLAMKYMTHVAKEKFGKEIEARVSKESQMEDIQMLQEDLGAKKSSSQEGRKKDEKSTPVEITRFGLTITPSNSKDSASEDDESEDESEEASPAKRCHHRKLKCRMPGCSAKVGDIKRHLKTHVVRKQLLDSDVLRAAAIITEGKKQRGPRLISKKSEAGRPGRFKKWCPVADCNTITTYIDQHLKKAQIEEEPRGIQGPPKECKKIHRYPGVGPLIDI